MKLTLRNIAAMFLSIWFVSTGRVNRSLKKVLKGEYILSIYFHNPDKKLFNSCVKWLLKKGLHFISLEEFHEIVEGNLSFPKGAVLITVDDGWQANKANIIDVVKRYNIPVTIFLTVEPVVSGTPYWWSYVKVAKDKSMLNNSLDELKSMENIRLREIISHLKKYIVLGRQAMTEEQVNESLTEGNLSIGSHTLTHPILPKCSDTEALSEIRNSKQILERIFSRHITSFAYPNGSYTQREIDLLRENGYQMAFNTRVDPITPQCIYNKYELPRLEVMEDVSFWETKCRMTGVWKIKKKIN